MHCPRSLRLAAVAAMLVTTVWAGPVLAKKDAPDAKHTSITGPVKGQPAGKTFVIATRKGTTTVDATGAKVRNKGKFASFDLIKGGTMVTAKGTLQGDTLKAEEVEVHLRGNQKK